MKQCFLCISPVSPIKLLLYTFMRYIMYIINCLYNIYYIIACEGEVTSCILVPSNVHSSLDHIWMSDSTNHVFVHGLRDGEWRTHRRVFEVAARVNEMCCLGNHVYLALANGTVLKYAKRKGMCFNNHCIIHVHTAAVFFEAFHHVLVNFEAL